MDLYDPSRDYHWYQFCSGCRQNDPIQYAGGHPADYITTAEAKGQTELKIIIFHALKNALIPVITTIGIQFGHLLGGAVLTESIFAVQALER